MGPEFADVDWSGGGQVVENESASHQTAFAGLREVPRHWLDIYLSESAYEYE